MFYKKAKDIQDEGEKLKDSLNENRKEFEKTKDKFFSDLKVKAIRAGIIDSVDFDVSVESDRKIFVFKESDEGLDSCMPEGLKKLLGL